MKINNHQYIKNIKIQPSIDHLNEIIDSNDTKILKAFSIQAELVYVDEMIPVENTNHIANTSEISEEIPAKAPQHEALKIQTHLHIPLVNLDLDKNQLAEKTLKGLALIAHPHPLYGGTMDNKIVQTLIKTLNDLGYIAVRFNFRGVGSSNGVHDNGISETEDAARVFKYLREDVPLLLNSIGLNINLQKWLALPIVLGGFSFGTYVISHLQNHPQFPKTQLQKMLMIGTAAKKWDIAAVSPDSLVMHGDDDDVIPLIDVQQWCQTHGLTLQIIEKAGHYFHGKLGHIKEAILKIL